MDVRQRNRNEHSEIYYLSPHCISHEVLCARNPNGIKETRAASTSVNVDQLSKPLTHGHHIV